MTSDSDWPELVTLLILIGFIGSMFFIAIRYDKRKDQ